MCGRATLTMVASSTTMSWAVAMTSRARPRRRLPPPAVAPGEAARPVTDRADRVVGRSGALPAPEAGDVTVSPLDLGARPWRPCELSRRIQARRQPRERPSPDPGDSRHPDRGLARR